MEMESNHYLIIHLRKRMTNIGIVSQQTRPDQIFDIALYRKASVKEGLQMSNTLIVGVAL